MMCMNILSGMQQEMRTILEDNILSFWADKMTDPVHGGFYGRITGTDKLEPQAVKGAVLNARILWTCSSAYRLLKKPGYLFLLPTIYTCPNFHHSASFLQYSAVLSKQEKMLLLLSYLSF